MRILLVEDEEKLALSIKRGLEVEGYIVDVCSNGRKAQSYINENHHLLDIIILDIGLPDKNGIEICKNARELSITLPILIVSARDKVDDVILGLDVGADDYLTKPFEFNIFIARIRALLRRPKSSFHTEIKIGDIILNTKTRKVFCSGKELKLSLKEFTLLEFLMKHKNEVVNREDIIENVWDINFDSFSNVVDAQIKNLRKKLEKVNYANLLESVRGVGYRFKG